MAAKQAYELTEEGVQRLRNEMDELKNVARPKNIEALKEARAQGDLSENADYDSAREEQGRIEGRILEIENILKNVKIIRKDSTTGVSTGKTVTVRYVESGKELTFALVGTIEADPFNQKVSNDSPLGKAIFGKEKGEKAIVRTEVGREYTVEILEIS